MIKKKLAAIFTLILFIMSIIPQGVIAAPEAYAFEDYSKTMSVSEYTGDMNLAIPLIHVPQPGGEAYPLVLNYQAGIKLDQPA